MSAVTWKQRVFKAAMLACAATLLSASYALDATSRFRDARSGAEDTGDVIAAFQKPAFLTYVKRRQMQSDPQLKRLSVGEVLPDSGVRYYGIPLRYGSPLYRYAVIGEEVVIVDPTIGRVIQVVE
jgi:hypothetical protein